MKFRSESRASGVILRQWLKTKEARRPPFYVLTSMFNVIFLIIYYYTITITVVIPYYHCTLYI